MFICRGLHRQNRDLELSLNKTKLITHKNIFPDLAVFQRNKVSLSTLKKKLTTPHEKRADFAVLQYIVKHNSSLR